MRTSRPTKRRRPAPSTTAIVPVKPTIVVQARRTRELKPEEIELLKRTVAKGCSDDEFALFLWVCRKHKLDPLTRQIYAVKRWLNKHHQEERPAQDGKGTIKVWVGGYQMTIQMGVDGYRSLAGRDHKDFGGCDEPEFVFSGMKTDAGKAIPEKATIRLWKKGLEHPVVGVAYWDEYGPVNLSSENAFFWNKMPKHMLAKCAEVLAIRKGYPELSDIYTDVEMVQAEQDLADGRTIVESDGRTPSGAPAGVPGVNTYRHQQAAIDAEIERQKHGEEPSSVEEMRERTLPATGNANRIGSQGQPGASAAEPSGQPPAGTSTQDPYSKDGQPPVGTIELDWTDKNAPIVRGVPGNVLVPLVPLIKEHCKAEWGKDGWYHIPPEFAQTLKEICQQTNHQFSEVFPNTSKGAANVPPPKKKETKKPEEPTVISGTIERVTSGMTARNAPTRQVKIGKTWYSSFVHPIFEYLDKAVGKDSELYLDARKQVVGIKRIGSRQFADDGRTPVVQKDEPRGGNLFEK